MDKSVLSFYLWAYDNDKNVSYILSELRKCYPDSDLVISSDNGYDFSDICNTYNACHYIHGKESHGYPTNDNRYGWTANAASIWFNRVYEACKIITTDYVMLMEEDVLVKDRFRFPATDIIMIPNIKNPISPSGMNWVKSRGGSVKYPYYSAGGGTIINRKKFIQAYDNHINDLLLNYDDLYEKSFNEGVIGWGWNDSLICVLMYAENATISTELPILESGNENDPAPIIHKFKKYYKSNTIEIKNKNVFISSACTNPLDMSVYDTAQRFQQLLETVESCNGIEDKINIITEGSKLSPEQYNKLSNIALIIENQNLDVRNKQSGTLGLWINALNTLRIDEASNVFFLSGRYKLTKEFSLKDFKGSYVFKNHWYDNFRGGWYGTQLFKVSGAAIPTFQKILIHAQRYITNYDIECSLYKSFKDLDIQPTEIEIVNCEGHNAPTGLLCFH
jgi:hypothetical protein